MGLFDKIVDDVLGFDPPKAQTASSLTYRQKVLEQLLSRMAESGIGQPGQQYPGEFAPGPSDIQQQVFGQTPGALQDINSLFGNLLGQGTSPIGQDYFDPIRQQVARLFERDIAPNIMATYGNETAAGSGIAQKALAEAGRDLGLGMNAQLAPLFAQLQEGQAGRSLQGASMTGMPLNFLGQVGDIGSLQRLIQSQQLAGEREKFDLSDPTRSPSVQLGLGLLGGNFAQPYLQQSAASSVLPALGSFMGGAGNMAALGGNIKSLAGGIQNLLGNLF
jgi:hypothetical protein